MCEDVKKLVGKTFSSFLEVENFMEDYQKTTKQLFTIIKSDKLNEGKFTTKINPKLKYYNLIYGCKYGVQTHKSTSKGQRRTR